jgi:hypothetical protein
MSLHTPWGIGVPTGVALATLVEMNSGAEVAGKVVDAAVELEIGTGATVRGKMVRTQIVSGIMRETTTARHTTVLNTEPELFHRRISDARCVQTNAINTRIAASTLTTRIVFFVLTEAPTASRIAPNNTNPTSSTKQPQPTARIFSIWSACACVTLTLMRDLLRGCSDSSVLDFHARSSSKHSAVSNPVG